MATGRTLPKHTRVYVDGYDLSGAGRTIGPLTWEYAEVDMTAPMSDAIKGYLLNQVNIGLGTFNGVLDNTTGAIHAVGSAISSPRNVMVPLGIRAAPAIGDPVFVGVFNQLSYNAADDGGAVVANIPFGAWNVNSEIAYTKPWGLLIHNKQAETAVNSAVAPSSMDNGAATTAGGYLMYQVFTANGTATVKIQDSATNANDAAFADLSGATSGVVDASSTPKSGLVALGITATVRRYLRWQIVLGTATTVTFALAFVRG